MIKWHIRYVIKNLFIIAIAFSYGCAGASSSPAPATAQLSPTAIDPRETYQTQTQTAANLAATAEAEQIAVSTVNAQATLNAQATTTAVFKATARMVNIHATATQIEARILSRKETETARTEQIATAQVRPLYTLLQEMEAEGLISSTDGEFISLWDFDESWAQINWFEFWSTGLNLKNFALWAKASWEIASQKANYFNSGCGFAFNIVDEDNFHVVFLNMDGNARLYRNSRGVLNLVKRNYFAQLSLPKGQAEFALVVNGGKVFFYVDRVLALQANDPAIREGDIGFTLMSGTNKGFGTRCQMQEVGFWELE